MMSPAASPASINTPLGHALHGSPDEREIRGSAVVGKRLRGPRRGARSLGRFPFLEYARRYLEKRRSFLAKSTCREWERKYRYMNAIMVGLREKGKVGTTSPFKMSA